MPPIRPEKTMTTSGSVLRRARLAAGLTQRQLAERAGLSRAAIWRLEAERSRLRREQTLAHRFALAVAGRRVIPLPVAGVL